MYKKLFLFLFLIGFLIKPIPSYALNIFIEKSSNDVLVGETIKLKVLLDTEGQNINVLEGVFGFIGSADISNINTANSVFELWPEEPNLSLEKEVSFTGGVAGGISGSNLRVLNFDITPTTIGEITIEPKKLSGYLDDGLGTEVVGSRNKFTIQVLDSKKYTDSIKYKLSDIPFPYLILLGIVLISMAYYLFKKFLNKNK